MKKEILMTIIGIVIFGITYFGIEMFGFAEGVLEETNQNKLRKNLL